ncbi:AcrR family transcriptional regulator [Arcanobacterium pluranimalium]|uniref:TetR/AcrR family transcriptional regulator n=1 Tax=Arcanobacterium pluranimalium TaxID=108028 RepID=UPI00195EBECF|nr:TetR/AcrR family transcriptional regulator [Arcanobacterium pluranimalium]MBM7824274.1 AcrR family transcriptional regulator [Arcanobacterium pluranimalium]
MMQHNTDPRFVRVRENLRAAVFELAAHKPVEEISVAELTRAAGISRTTFYKHGVSPAQFIADLIIEELEPHLNKMSAIIDEPTDNYLVQWRDVYADILRGIKARKEIYVPMFSRANSSGVLGYVISYLADFYEGYVQLFEQHVENDLTMLWKEMAVSQQVHNFLAVIGAWCRQDCVDDPVAVVNTYLSLAPPWQLARFDAHGKTSLGRSLRFLQEPA